MTFSTQTDLILQSDMAHFVQNARLDASENKARVQTHGLRPNRKMTQHNEVSSSLHTDGKMMWTSPLTELREPSGESANI